MRQLLKRKITEKTARAVLKTKYKVPIWVKNFKGQEKLHKEVKKQYSKVSVKESPKNTQEEYIQLHVISYLQSESILVLEASLCISNMMVQM